jgi:hypothetical protein
LSAFGSFDFSVASLCTSIGAANAAIYVMFYRPRGATD